MSSTKNINALRDFLAEHDSVAVLTGAGVSTASGIPDYRDRNGEWQDLIVMRCDLATLWNELEHMIHESDWRRHR